ncbi:PRC-barrel domain-containing protein [Arenibaculum pallidiluteum]|uniref:PRC-barrel domain-containing protein n=1 Tax=Arenibaculum pallidiluteum TaxID=2812559 RepID=UPI001A95943B|nr:PRC-barrel domain-containing protein [Arenibaculum pallidiluteum]
MLKPILLGTALMLGTALPAAAQVAPDMGGRAPVDQKGMQTPETLGAGRSMGAPEGNAQARPADPSRQPQTGTPEATADRDSTGATNSETGSRPGATPSPGRQSAAGERAKTDPRNTAEDIATGRPGYEGQGQAYATPVDRHRDQARSASGTVGGGAPAESQVRMTEIDDFKVLGRDGKEIGSVSEVLLNWKNGRIDTLNVGAGSSITGTSEKVYGVPWDRVESVDARRKEIRLSIAEQELAETSRFGGSGNDSAQR